MDMYIFGKLVWDVQSKTLVGPAADSSVGSMHRYRPSNNTWTTCNFSVDPRLKYLAGNYASMSSYDFATGVLYMPVSQDSLACHMSMVRVHASDCAPLGAVPVHYPDDSPLGSCNLLQQIAFPN